MSVSNLSTGLRPGVCTSTTRPTAPYEGQMIYETDTDMVAIWNGTAWRYISATTPTNGTVLQVVHLQSTTQVISNTTTFVGTSCTTSITPKSNTSKILVSVSIPLLASAAYCGIGLRLVRNSTVVWSTIASNYFGTDMGNMSTIFYLDSPSSTSATTYSVEFNRSAGTGNAYVHLVSSPGNMVLMEVSA